MAKYYPQAWRTGGFEIIPPIPGSGEAWAIRYEDVVREFTTANAVDKFLEDEALADELRRAAREQDYDRQIPPPW